MSDDGIYQQNPDGSYSPAEPMGWQGSGIDWEVIREGKRYRADAYDEDMHVGMVTARTRIGLMWKMRRAGPLGGDRS